MRQRPALIVATALTAALSLGACTSASQDLGGGSTPTAAATAVAKDAEIAALVPDAVAKDGKLTVGSNLTYAPLEFVDADGRTPVGLDVDIATAMAALMGLQLDIQSAEFDSIIPAIGTRYEVGMSAFTINPERLATVTMVSYFNAGSQLAVQAGNPANVDPDNLCGLTVGVQTGTVQQTELETLNAACATPMTILPYASQADVTTNLVGGKLDAMYADSPITAYAVGQAGDALQTLGDIRDAAPYGVVVAKDDAELAEAVRAALQRLMDDGTLAAIAAHWGNEQGALATAEINPQA